MRSELMQTNQINVNVFKKVIKKSTLNLALEFTRIKFKDGRLTSGMTTTGRDIITILNMPNTLITLSEQDEVEFNLGGLEKPLHTFDGFLKNYQQEVVEAKVYDETINTRIVFKPIVSLEGQTVSHQHTIGLVSPTMVEPFVLQSNQQGEVPYFFNMDLTAEHIREFENTKFEGGRFGKVYIKVINNKLYIDTTDQNNMYENDHLLLLTTQDVNFEDKIMCFEYANFCHLLDVVKDELTSENPKQLCIGFGWIAEGNIGIIHIYDVEKTEQYFLTSRDI